MKNDLACSSILLMCQCHVNELCCYFISQIHILYFHQILDTSHMIRGEIFLMISQWAAPCFFFEVKLSALRIIKKRQLYKEEYLQRREGRFKLS